MTVAVTLAGIVLPALLLVIALRRWIVPLPWRIALLFLVLTLGFLHGAVFTSKLPVPVDEVARGYPYRGVFGEVNARNPLTNDTAKLFLPWMHVAREELAHFRAPLWNRYAFSGYPLLGNGESAPFSPLFLVTLFVPLPKQIVAMAGIKVFISLVFGFLFVKRFGASDSSACFAASAYAFSVTETVNLYYSSGTVMSMLPAALYAVTFATEVASRRGVVFVALTVGSLMAGGHPESVLHIALAVAAVSVIELVLADDKSRWVAGFLSATVGVVAALALSAPAWIPSALQVPLSARYAALHATPSDGSFPLTALWAMVSPNGFGNPVRHNWNWVGNYATVAISYVGLIPLVLAIGAVLSPRTAARERIWIGVATVIFLISMNWTWIGHVFREMPLLDVTAHDKFRFVACFLAAAAGALWLDREPDRWLVALIAIPVAFAALYVWYAKPAVLSRADLVAPLALIAFVVLPRRSAFVLVTVELFVLNAGFNALVDAKYYKPQLAIIDALRRHAPDEPFRVVGRDWVFLPNAAAQYRLEDVRGSDPMAYRWYVDRLRPISLPNPQFDVLRIGDVDNELIDFLNVRFLLDAPGAAAGAKWRPIYAGSDGTLFENMAVRSRFTIDQGRVVTHEDAPSSFTLRVDAAAPAVIESSQPAANGWSVYVDGKRVPIDLVRGGFIGFRVGRGPHHVRVVYRPRAFYSAVLLSVFTALLLLVPKSGNRDRGVAVVTGPQRGK